MSGRARASPDVPSTGLTPVWYNICTYDTLSGAYTVRGDRELGVEVEGVRVSGNRVATSCQLRCQLSVQQHSQPQVPLALVMRNSETEKNRRSCLMLSRSSVRIVFKRTHALTCIQRQSHRHGRCRVKIMRQIVSLLNCDLK